jgi:quercetin dioxygenase-like cupin family protein
MAISWSKIWGENKEIFNNDTVSVNVLDILKSTVCSKHSHKSKSNLFYVLEGVVEIDIFYNEYNPHVIKLLPGASFLVEPGVVHRFRGVEASKMIEVMFVKYDANDIVRQDVGHKEE